MPNKTQHARAMQISNIVKTFIVDDDQSIGQLSQNHSFGDLYRAIAALGTTRQSRWNDAVNKALKVVSDTFMIFKESNDILTGSYMMDHIHYDDFPRDTRKAFADAFKYALLQSTVELGYGNL